MQQMAHSIKTGSCPPYLTQQLQHRILTITRCQHKLTSSSNHSFINLHLMKIFNNLPSKLHYSKSLHFSSQTQVAPSKRITPIMSASPFASNYSILFISHIPYLYYFSQISAYAGFCY